MIISEIVPFENKPYYPIEQNRKQMMRVSFFLIRAVISRLFEVGLLIVLRWVPHLFEGYLPQKIIFVRMCLSS